MNRNFLIAAFVIFAAVAAPAQTVTAYFPNDGLTTGSSNAFPWNTGATTGYTTVNIYPAATLLAQGVTAGMHLAGLALLPQTGSGNMTQPTVKVFVGHAVPTAATTPTLWINSMADPTPVWDTTVDGPLTAPGWAAAVWAPVSFRASSCFYWDGVRDIVVMFSQGGGWTGSYSVTSPPTSIYTRHGTTQYMPLPGTAQTTTGVLGPRMRMTFDQATALSVTSTAGDLVVTLGSVGPTMFEGYTLVSTTTTSGVGGGGLLGINPDAVTWAFLQTPAGYGNPLHWLAQPAYPGIYPWAPFALPPGSMTPFAGQSWDFVSFAFAPGFASYELTCVRRVTF